MPQFSPIIVCLLFFYVWMIYLFSFIGLWWFGKRRYSF